MEKYIFVINGSGGVGKDTICDAAAQFWKVQNISSITPILDVAYAAGWDGEKTPAARRFLSELKEVCTEFNDLPFTYCMTQYQLFMQSDAEVLFVHIREPAEITRFRRAVHHNCYAVLVRRAQFEQTRGPLGNRSDDEVLNYAYDYTFNNDGPLSILPKAVQSFFQSIMS